MSFDNIIKKAIKNKELLAVKAKYNHEALFFYALAQSNDFFFGVEEFDFALDGYQIRVKEDISDVKVIDNFSAEINVMEGLLDQIIEYKIDLETWESIFTYLYNLNEIISIEREYNDEENFFVIGKVLKVTETSIWFKDFDINGNWNKELNIIPFDVITTVRINSNYIKVWSKYVESEDEVKNEN
ncbi:MAG: hypothetical protein RBQ97_02155 [Acholeplasma sp.]|nr:hypothetical protein [Acholeplasma sp.]